LTFDDIDRLNLIVRRFEAIVFILGFAAANDPALAAVEGIVRPTDEQLQAFKAWFNGASSGQRQEPIMTGLLDMLTAFIRFLTGRAPWLSR